MNDLDALMAAANPVAADELTYGPRQETLLRSIIEEPARRSSVRLRVRLRWMLPAVAAAMAITAVLWHILVPQSIPEQRYVVSGGAHAVLLAAAEHADRTGTKRFWHSKGEVGQLLRRNHDGHRYTLLITTPTETWDPRDPIDGDAVHSYDIGGARIQPASAADAEAYREDGSPGPNENSAAGIAIPDPPDGPELAGDSIFEGDPTRLPVDPAKLRMTMLTWVRDHGGLPAHPDAWLFREATKLLDSPARIPSPAVRGALYRMLAGLPGVRSLGTVRDPLGRPSVGVALREHTAALGTIDWQLLISPSSDFVMATRAVIVRPGVTNRDLPVGATQYLTVKRTAGWTDQPPKHRLPGARR
jgi:hypothetical protein